MDAQVETRDRQRTEHSRVLLSALSTLVRAAETYLCWVRGTITKDWTAWAPEGSQHDAVTRATKRITGWETEAAQREQGLARALEAATECMVGYAAAQGGKKGMGTREAALPDAAAGRLGLAPDAALGAFDEWVERVGAGVAAKETDAALQARTPSANDCWPRLSFPWYTSCPCQVSSWYKDCTV